MNTLHKAAQAVPACESCKHYKSGSIHGYQWAECKFYWSDDRPLIGVIKNACNKFSVAKEQQ